MVKNSVWTDSQREIDRFKWIESEKVGYDLGEWAIRRWIKEHWSGYLRARWLEHIQGKNFWIELDRGDYGILFNIFPDKALLLDRIVDRLIAGQENLHVILWALTGAFRCTRFCKSSKRSISIAAVSRIVLMGELFLFMLIYFSLFARNPGSLAAGPACICKDRSRSSNRFSFISSCFHIA